MKYFIKIMTLFEKIGEKKLRLIVKSFYSRVFKSEVIGSLFKTDKELIMEKQFEFLTQFLGGPQLYSQKYGHPKMRMRHLPHAIDESAKMEWLKCMHEAIHEVISDDEELASALYQCFPPIAQHMVNR